MALSTPVALFIFNRPDLTRVTFDAIAQVRPRKLLIIADGPRSAEEAEKCRQSRSVKESVTWPCEVVTNFSEVNLGCRERLASGLDWVFAETSEAIIIEDDCLPAPSFFSFCEQLLRHYRDDERIMHIGGSSFVSDEIQLEHSYYLSRYTFPWGWASWRRAWKYYDKTMKSWPQFEARGMLEHVFETEGEQQFWRDILNQTYRGELNAWDFQWFYAVWSQGGLSIIPRVNLVSNLGFRSDATNTNTAHKEHVLANIPRGSIDEIHHPHFVIRNRQADDYVFKKYFGGDGEAGAAPTGLHYYWLALKYKLGQLRARA